MPSSRVSCRFSGLPALLFVYISKSENRGLTKVSGSLGILTKLTPATLYCVNVLRANHKLSPFFIHEAKSCHHAPQPCAPTSQGLFCQAVQSDACIPKAFFDISRPNLRNANTPKLGKMSPL